MEILVVFVLHRISAGSELSSSPCRRSRRDASDGPPDVVPKGPGDNGDYAELYPDRFPHGLAGSCRSMHRTAVSLPAVFPGGIRGDSQLRGAVGASGATSPAGNYRGRLQWRWFQDIAIANAASATVSVYLGSGSGTFSQAATVTLPTGCSAAYIASAKFTRAAQPDLLVVCAWAKCWFCERRTRNLRHTDLHHIATRRLDRQSDDCQVHPAIADFNGDGKLDSSSRI